MPGPAGGPGGHHMGRYLSPEEMDIRPKATRQLLVRIYSCIKPYRL